MVRRSNVVKILPLAFSFVLTFVTCKQPFDRSLNGTSQDSQSLQQSKAKTEPNKDGSNRPVALVDRNHNLEEALAGLNTELSYCSNWLDTVEVLSNWLYQNTRVGDPALGIDNAFGGSDLNQWYSVITEKDLEWFYNVNNSDSIVSNCGSHCYFATRLYGHFGIKSYHLSIRKNLSQSEEGHMINVLYNPQDNRWYPVDHYYGLRWTSKGAWIDMEAYRDIARQGLSEINAETFGVFKFHIYDTLSSLIGSWSLQTWEIALIEKANHEKYFRVVAPYTLRKRFPDHKAQFDAIAASYNQPPHSDWIDLARRLPLYGAKLFAPPPLREQRQADRLLNNWMN